MGRGEGGEILEMLAGAIDDASEESSVKFQPAETIYEQPPLRGDQMVDTARELEKSLAEADPVRDRDEIIRASSAFAAALSPLKTPSAKGRSLTRRAGRRFSDVDSQLQQLKLMAEIISFTRAPTAETLQSIIAVLHYEADQVEQRELINDIPRELDYLEGKLGGTAEIAKLAGVSVETARKWRKKKTYPSTKTSLDAAVKGFFKLERELGWGESQSSEWFYRPNPHLRGQSPSELVGEDYLNWNTVLRAAEQEPSRPESSH